MQNIEAQRMLIRELNRDMILAARDACLANDFIYPYTFACDGNVYEVACPPKWVERLRFDGVCVTEGSWGVRLIGKDDGQPATYRFVN